MSKVLGLDIGTYEIKIAYGELKGDKVSIEDLASVYNPTGQFLPSAESDFQKLADTIMALVSEHKLKGKPTHVCLPESMAFTNIIQMPNLSQAELSSSIHWEAEQHIPVPLEDVNLEYEILYKPPKDAIGEKMRVLLVASRKDYVDRLVELCRASGLDVVGIETTMLANHRALAPQISDQEGTAIIHMGAIATDILVLDKLDLVINYSANVGGLALTRAVQQNLNLSPSQAEEYKRAYGMDPNQLEGQVRGSMSGVLNNIVLEIKKALQYYQTSTNRTPLRKILLSGGAVYMPGLTTFLADTFSLEIQMSNPTLQMAGKSSVSMPDNAASYTPAIGLVMKHD